MLLIRVYLVPNVVLAYGSYEFIVELMAEKD